MTATVKIPKKAEAFVAAAKRDARMTCREMALLVTVAQSPGHSTGVYAASLGFHTPVVTRAVLSGIANGLMRQEQADDDRRKTRLWVTPAGAELLAELR